MAVNRSMLKNCRRLVVKVGTSTVTHGTGQVNLRRLEELTRELSDLSARGVQVLLVSSGAVGAGLGRMGWTEKPAELPVKQALAALGQGLLMGHYERFFAQYGRMAAQVLLTRDAFADRRRYLNITNTLDALLKLGAIPVINENDTVAVDEIKFGDNDTLSALVACAAKADLLVILSDVDGLRAEDPKLNPDAPLISEVRGVSPEIRAKSGSTGSSFASGGMFTKLSAADIAGGAGIPMVIASGAERWALSRLLEGEGLGTLFLPPEKTLRARKGWVAWADAPHGRLTVDDGAVRALVEEGASLLSPGVKSFEGHFRRGETVFVVDEKGQEVARGRTDLDSETLARILRKAPEERRGRQVLHRDNLTLTGQGDQSCLKNC